jgi:prolyl 4-hydroxylase
VRFEILCRDPQILLIPDFVSAEEARYLMEVGDRRMGRSMVVCDEPGGCVDARRTSESAHLGNDPNVEPVRERARWFSRIPTCETIQIVRYRVGQEFRPHYDQFDTRTKEGARAVREGGQRVATLLVYLNEPGGGGATVFPKAGLSVLPRARAAVFWRHQLPSGQDDPKTLHGGAPVERGEKWAANLWLRGSPIRASGVAAVQINPQLTPLRRHMIGLTT